MTNEEAKQLETGDKILIEAIFDRIDEDGDAAIEYTNSLSDCECGFIDPKHIVGVASETQLNKLKYDPCRLFRKGDKVRVVEWNGRSYWDYDHHTELTTGRICEVNEDEKSEQEEGCVSVDYLGQIRCVPPCFLELITPVEELEQYHINEIYDIDDGKLIGYEVTSGDTRDSIFYGGENHLRTIEQAKAAAAEECDRLNTEYRKDMEQ